MACLQGDKAALRHCTLQELAQLEATVGAAWAQLRRALSAAREQEEHCGLCMERPKGVVFQCGHQTCALCSTVDECPFCRAPVTARIVLFSS